MAFLHHNVLIIVSIYHDIPGVCMHIWVCAYMLACLCVEKEEREVHYCMCLIMCVSNVKIILDGKV